MDENANNDTDSEENYTDADMITKENKKDKKKKEKSSEEVALNQYDDLKRNPSFAQGDKSMLWELLYLKNHYNPIIRKITYLILNLKFDQVNYKGNPIVDFTCIAILKRFSLAP